MKGPPALLRLAYGVIALWVLLMISLPIAKWIWGDAAIPLGATITVLCQATAVILLLWYGWGGKRTLVVTAAIMVLTWGIEAAGSRTGLLFGDYTYTPRLQPQIAFVPLLIPLAWLMMLPPAWAIAHVITSSYRSLSFLLFSALAFTAWDLFLDPQMVSWGFWTWDSPGGYFGIPWHNYLGWLFVSALITALVRPKALPTTPLILIYAITWFLESIGLIVFWGLVGPGMVGCLAMGVLLMVALWRLRMQPHPLPT